MPTKDRYRVSSPCNYLGSCAVGIHLMMPSHDPKTNQRILNSSRVQLADGLLNKAIVLHSIRGQSLQNAV